MACGTIRVCMIAPPSSIRCWLVALGCSAALVAQTTWTVNASPGSGAQFHSLAAAVAVAADGDVIVCQHPMFGESLGGFTTNKGLTIVGDAHGVPLTTLATPIQVVGLPAGSTFRMAGFQSIQDGELRIVLQNCAGRVELDNLQARSPDFFFPSGPAIVVDQCASVVLRDVVDFGTPAVRVDSSRVVLSSCWLGLTRISVGGGPCVEANNAEVDVVQPVFRTDHVWTFTEVAVTVGLSLLPVPAIEIAKLIGLAIGDAFALLLHQQTQTQIVKLGHRGQTTEITLAHAARTPPAAGCLPALPGPGGWRP